jgi:protein TonB
MKTRLLWLGLMLVAPLAGRAQAPGATPPTPPASFFTADFQAASPSDTTAFCSEITFRDSLSGVARVYYPSGKLRQYVPYSNVYRRTVHGTLTTWYEDGQMCTKEEYLNGVRQGDLLTYYPDGVLKRQERYENGHCGVGKCYGPNGAPVQYFAYEQLPLYPGGDVQLLKELKKALRLTLPEETAMRREAYGAKSMIYGAQRQVDVELAIAPDGRITNARVVSSTARMLNAAALRAVAKLQRSFVPGRRDGQTIASFMTVPVYYTVQAAPVYRDTYRPNPGYSRFRQQGW